MVRWCPGCCERVRHVSHGVRPPAEGTGTPSSGWLFSVGVVLRACEDTGLDGLELYICADLCAQYGSNIYKVWLCVVHIRGLPKKSYTQHVLFIRLHTNLELHIWSIITVLGGFMWFIKHIRRGYLFGTGMVLLLLQVQCTPTAIGKTTRGGDSI